MYIYQLEQWPSFRWNRNRLADSLAGIRHRQGRLIGQMEGLGFDLKREAVLRTVTADVIKTSEIEGERLNQEDVRSSVARHLGLEIVGLKPTDRNVDGVVEMTLDATGNYDAPLTAKRLFEWHSKLFPTRHSGLFSVNTGSWRTDWNGPMQVVSVQMGKERVHFEAPAAARVPDEMGKFLNWFNRDFSADPVAKAALAHLWLVTVHPFDNGNGRIARAVADMALARSEGISQRFYSMSTQIREERAAYYRTLEQTQSGSLDVSRWMEWFFGCLDRAIGSAQKTLEVVLARSRFWESLGQMPVNDRQRRILNQILTGFEGKLTTGKYAQLTKVSTDTALRDIQSLVERGILIRDASGGRSTSYSVATLAPAL